MRSLWLKLLLLPFGLAAVAETPPDRSLDGVVPALTYGPFCSSTVRMQNLVDTPVTVEVEAHRGSGALVPLAGSANRVIRLGPGQESAFRLDIEEETTTAWVKVRERIPEARSAPAVALSGATECRTESQSRVANREVAFPTRSPWFSGDIANLHGAVITMINTSDQAARASVCYSAGSLYSVPSPAHPTADLHPICSVTLDVQIPPFGTREFPVERDGNSQFSLRTHGEAIVLQVLRPRDEGRIYSVDSSIQFGEEVPEARRPER